MSQTTPRIVTMKSVLEVVASHTGMPEVEVAAKPVEEWGKDSLDTIEITLALEEQFGVAIDDELVLRSAKMNVAQLTEELVKLQQVDGVTDVERKEFLDSATRTDPPVLQREWQVRGDGSTAADTQPERGEDAPDVADVLHGAGYEVVEGAEAVKAAIKKAAG